jgi:hypothetical protein
MFTQQYILKLKSHFNDELINSFTPLDKKYIEKIIIFKQNIKKTLEFDYNTKILDLKTFLKIKQKLEEYTQYLKDNNKHPSSITKKRYNIFIHDDLLSEKLYKRMCSNKIKNMKTETERNPLLISSSLEGFIYRNGEEEGIKKYKSHYTNKKYSSLRRIEGWIKLGYSEEEAKIKLKTHQSTFSLKKCIEKYGLEEGTNRWKERQEQWQNTLNSKSIEEITKINKSKIRKSGAISKFEQDLVNTLLETLDIETQFMLSRNNKRYLYDIRYKNKLIEFNGTYWHCDPRYYEENYFRKESKIFARDVWNNDRIKSDVANENGFDLLVIWESDFKNDKNKEIEKCIKFLSEK